MKLKKDSSLRVIDKVFVGILLTIFGGIVFHAPLSVGFGSLFPDVELFIKSWKEIVMAVAGVLAAVILWQRRQWVILKDPLLLLIIGYTLLHLLLIPLLWTGALSTVAGVLIDLRYVWFFALVYIALRLYPTLRRPFIFVFFGGALVVGLFAILQVTILPKDILAYIGYGSGSIEPYLYLDQNPDYVRINSTLRGPNSLGAFAMIVAGLLTALWVKGNRKELKKFALPVAVLSAGALVSVWFSYSRSALLAFFLAGGAALFWAASQKVKKILLGVAAVMLVVAGVGLYLARDSSFVANVILHDNPTTGAEQTSNDGHIDSLQEGLGRMMQQPLGGGVGSTGSASLFGDSPIIIENQYLFIAHEVGWLGLALFLVIQWKVFAGLWKRRSDWLALGVFASGLGIVLMSLLLPILVDDTVAIIWWGLVALALGGRYGTLNQKTKRTA